MCQIQHFDRQCGCRQLYGLLDGGRKQQSCKVESPFGNFSSRDEIRHFEQEHVTKGMAVGKRHLGFNIVIREEKDDNNTAFVTNDLIVVETKEIPYIVATARYDDSKVIKTDKGWKFQYRNLKVDEGFMKLMASEAGVIIEAGSVDDTMKFLRKYGIILLMDYKVNL